MVRLVGHTLMRRAPANFAENNGIFRFVEEGIMMSRKLSNISPWLSSMAVLATLGPAWSAARAQDVPPPLPVDPNAAYAAPAPAQTQADPNAEVLTRGPVHEAYAAPQSTGQSRRSDRPSPTGRPH